MCETLDKVLCSKGGDHQFGRNEQCRKCGTDRQRAVLSVLFIANVHVAFHHSIKNSRSNLYQNWKFNSGVLKKKSTGDQFHHFPWRGQKHLKWPCQALASDKLHVISLLFSKIKSTLHNAWNDMKYRLISIYHAFILVLPYTGGILFAINSWHREATTKRWNLETGIVQRGS